MSMFNFLSALLVVGLLTAFLGTNEKTSKIRVKVRVRGATLGQSQGTGSIKTNLIKLQFSRK